MLRIVYLAILPGMALTACAAWVNADTKQMYSNRPVGYSVPTPYYGTPMAPRFMAPPVTPVRVATTPRVVATNPAMAPLVATDPSAPQAVEKTTFILREPSPEINVEDELDAFYARMAKIQLEKHELAKALDLVKSIKSETFKVRTLVSLAEYVSRDKTYKSEAEQLYRLALEGMEALNKKQPLRIDTSEVKVAPPTPTPTPAPREVTTLSVQELDLPPAPFPPVTSVPQTPQPVDLDSPETGVLPNRAPIEIDNGIGLNGRNGKQSAPPPPNGADGPANGITDSVMENSTPNKVEPPQVRRPLLITENEDDGLIPLTPPKTPIVKPEVPPSTTSNNNDAATTTPDPGFVRPRQRISIDGDSKEEPTPTVVPKQPEEEAPPRTPTRRRSSIVLPVEVD